MAAGTRTVSSLQEARRAVASILEELNASPALAIGAAVNPLLALEELGYEIPAEVRAELEDRIRFGAEKAARIRTLRAQIFERVGRRFEPESEESLRRVLRDDLQLELDRTPDAEQSSPGRGEGLPRSLVLAPAMRWGRQSGDPLERFRGSHPAIEPLLEYRKLEASEPRLASVSLYSEVRSGRRRTPLTAVRASLKPQRS